MRRQAHKLKTLDALIDTYGDAVLPIQPDVTDHAPDFAAVKRDPDHFGRLGIVINNTR